LLAKNRLSLKKHAICKESVARTLIGQPEGRGAELLNDLTANDTGFGAHELLRPREAFGLLTEAERGRWSGEPAV
jgi:hypothetical protein